MGNKLENWSGDERGMTGIGVLILFIALVLVAAIASGLILDTAGVLQNTAQNTGEQSTSEVSDRLSVLSSSGDVVNVEGLESLYTEDISVTGVAVGANMSSPHSFTVSDGERVDSVNLNGWSASTDATLTATVYDNSTNTNVGSGTVSVSAADSPSDYKINVSMTDVSSTGEYYVELTSDTSGDFSGEMEVVGTDGTVDRVSVLHTTVYRSPGASDVDLQQATIEYFSPYGTAFLLHEEEYNALSSSELENFTDNLASFSTEAVKDDDGSVPVLNSRDDRAIINIGLHNDFVVTDQPDSMIYLHEGDSATLRLTTQHGATTTEIVNVPESLAGYDGSSVVL